VKKGIESCINTFYELKACMWKHFIPPLFRINREQKARIENFIDIGDAFIQNLAKFSRLEKDFKHNEKSIRESKQNLKSFESMKRKEKKKSLRNFVLKENKRKKR